MSCQPSQRGEQLIDKPVLIVQIMSPGSERHDRRIKVPAYRGIGSVQEILLIDPESLYAEVLRRDGEQWMTNLLRGRNAALQLTSVGLSIAMAELYDGIDIQTDPEP